MRGRHAIADIDGSAAPAETACVAVAIDTLAYARKLQEAGFTEQQAEGQANALAAAMTDSLATKQDLRELEARLDVRFAAVDARFASVDARFASIDARFPGIDERFSRLELLIAELEKRMILRFEQQRAEFEARFSGFDAKLAALEHCMTLRLGGMMMASVGAMTALLKLT